MTDRPAYGFLQGREKNAAGALTGLEAPVRGALLPRAQMAELVDAPASGAGDRKVVEVRVLFWAPSVLLGMSEDVQ